MGSGDFECDSSGPSDTWPPVLPIFMLHRLYNPDCLDEHDTLILEQPPKKTYGELKEAIGPPLEGRDLCFQEDFDIRIIIGIVFIILFLVSLLFLVLWTVLKGDIQGSSGVSAYRFAVASVLGIWIATGVEASVRTVLARQTFGGVQYVKSGKNYCKINRQQVCTTLVLKSCQGYRHRHTPSRFAKISKSVNTTTRQRYTTQTALLHRDG